MLRELFVEIKGLFIDFYCRFYDYFIPTAYADAGTQPNDRENAAIEEDTSDDEASEEDQQMKKKAKREKVGFRDRKVAIHDKHFVLDTCTPIIICFLFSFFVLKIFDLILF